MFIAKIGFGLMEYLWWAARVLHISLYVACALHAWKLARLSCRHARLAKGATRSLVGSWIKARARPGNQFDAVVEKRMTNLRLRTAELSMTWLSPAVGLVLLAFSMWGEVHMSAFQDSERQVDVNYFMMLIMGMVVYLPCVLVRVDVFAVTSARVHVAYGVIIAIMAITLFVAKGDPCIFVRGWFIRVTFRVVGGLIMLDCRKTAVWNVVLSLAVCGKFILGDMGKFLVVQEVLVLCATVGSTLCAERWQRACVRSTVMARASESARQAVHALLSVFCDSVVHLGPDLEILRPAPELAHLLCVRCVTAAAVADDEHTAGDRIGSLVGQKLVHYIATEDRQRLSEFIASLPLRGLQANGSNQQAELEESLETNITWPAGPPGAIHLRMSSSARLDFPVDLFAVNFPDQSGQPGHLIGIRDAGSHGSVTELAPQELRNATKATSSASCRSQPSPACARGNLPGTTTQPAAAAPAAAAIQTCSHGVPSQALSSISSTSRAPAAPFEVAGIALEVDAMTENAEVRWCTLHLAPVTHAAVEASVPAMQQRKGRRGAVEGRYRCLCLADLVDSPNQTELIQWLQVQANCLQSGRDPTDLGHMRLHFCQPHFSMNISVEASRASVDVIDLSDGESDETDAETPQPKFEGVKQQQQEQKPPTFPVLLQLDGLVRRRPRNHRSRAMSASSSNSSRGSRGSRAPSLPPIQEDHVAAAVGQSVVQL